MTTPTRPQTEYVTWNPKVESGGVESITLDEARRSDFLSLIAEYESRLRKPSYRENAKVSLEYRVQIELLERLLRDRNVSPSQTIFEMGLNLHDSFAVGIEGRQAITNAIHAVARFAVHGVPKSAMM